MESFLNLEQLERNFEVRIILKCFLHLMTNTFFNPTDCATQMYL